MSKWYRVNTSVLNIRTGAGSNYQDVGDLLLNDQIEVTETMGGWHHIIRWRRGDLDKTLPNSSSWCSSAYTVEIANPVPPDPEPTPTVKPLTITIEGEDYETVTITVPPKYTS